MHKLLCASLLAVPAAVAGCGVSSINQWTAKRGGILRGAATTRAAAICRRLTCHTLVAPLRIGVLNTPRMVAYSWPNGRIFISAGLASRLSRGELAAAIAHEMGHLINDRRVHALMALRGRGQSPDIEVAADATGARVLQAAGIPQLNMVRMLCVVARNINNRQVRRAMLRRAYLLCGSLGDLPNIRSTGSLRKSTASLVSRRARDLKLTQPF